MKAQFTLTVSGMSNRPKFRNLILGARFPQTSKIAQVAADWTGIRGVCASPENRHLTSRNMLLSGMSARLRRTRSCNSAWTNSNEAGVAERLLASGPGKMSLNDKTDLKIKRKPDSRVPCNVHTMELIIFRLIQPRTKPSHNAHVRFCICLADAEQQNAKTQGCKEIPFGSRAWAAFGRILGRAAGESAILLSSRSARAFSRGSPKDAPARSAAPTPVAQCRSLRPCAFASLRFASSSI